MNVGIVLSGGMAKGAYQIGALRAIQKYVPIEHIKYISGASIGVLNGYAYAVNRLDKAEEIWKNACCEDSSILVSKILKSNLLQQGIQSISSEEDEIASKFYCTLLDYRHMNVVYKNITNEQKQLIPRYLKASVALPFYNKAVLIDGIPYYDGAMIDNIPVHPLMKHKLDYMICIYFDDSCYKFENSYFDNKIIKITFPVESMLKQSLLVTKSDIEQMIEVGYERTSDILASILYNGFEDIDYIYKAIGRKNRFETRSLRITGDVIVTNTNRVAQKFARRKVIV